MISDIKLISITHIAFYRRHPWLLVLFLLGFSLGSALLTAIAGLNQEAKSRYQQSSALIESPITHLIKPLTGEPYIDGNIWLELRRHGFVNTQPVLRGQLKTQSGKTLSIQGVDTLLWLKSQNSQPTSSSSDMDASLLSFSSLLVDAQFADRVSNKNDDTAMPLILEHNQEHPNIHLVDDIGLWAITDIANADYLLHAKGQLSFIELSDIADVEIDTIKQLIAGRAQLVDADQQEFDVLSQAFFFNLTALALLGYIVAAFLSFNAIKLTFAARRTLMSQMQLLGCTRASINAALAIEIVFLAFATALLGTIGGFVMANGLVLDVNRTLMGLYKLDKALVVNWQWTNVLLGFVLNSLALSVIIISQNNRLLKKTHWIFFGAFTSALLALVWLLNFANSAFQALLLCFFVLVLFMLIAPKLLTLIVSVPLSLKNPLAQWIHADTKFSLKDLHVAIIAILVALGSAIGMQIMVKSFSNTLNAHLDKQLSADIYLRTNSLDETLRQQLANQPEVKKLSIYLQSEGKINEMPAKLASFGPTYQHYQQISLTSGEKVNAQHFIDSGCLANEQSYIKFNMAIGSTIQFVQNSTTFSCRIAGFYYDYGNPGISIITLENRHKLSGLNKVNFGYSMRLNDNANLTHFTERLINDFEQDSTQILENKRFKKFANALFNDTFMVTKALNGFILAIALLSLCTSLLSLSANQVKQLTILCNLGITQQQLVRMKLAQTAAIVFFTALMAIPLGFALGFALLKFVMPIAFGWTIHFSLDLNTLLLTCFTLVLVACICAYLPVKKLTRVGVNA